jgi:hypothetical protein
MLRTGFVTIAMIIALQGFCFGQGILDSLLGPGGLGVWGGDAGNQYNNPQMWGGAQGPQQQPYQQPSYPGQQQMSYPQPGAQAYPPGYSQQGYSNPQAPGYQQQGLYADWQNYPAAPIGGNPQEYSAQQQPAATQQYQAPQQSAAPQQYQAPPQYQAQQQYQPPQQYTTAPPQAGPTQPMQAAPGQSPLRPGQYVPGEGPITADDLPAGAVRVTTTTPEGTRVEYYPPTGELGAPPPEGAVRRPARQPKPKPAAAKPQGARQAQPREQNVSGAESPGSSSIAMPKPVEIPQGQDPRYGWGAAVNRGPVAPSAR